MVVTVCLLIFLCAVAFLNPYRVHTIKLVADHSSTLQFGAYIDVYDLSLLTDVDRLFIIRPENVIVYNNRGTLFYYLNSASVFCPQEFALVRFNKYDIDNINQTGVYHTVCTNVNSIALVDHFVSLKSNIPDERLLLSLDQINYSIIDIINLLISSGYVEIK